jgi:hypothetical protein
VTGTGCPLAGRRNAANALALAAALSLFAGCGGKSFAVGSIPFPAEKPVFVAEGGKETTGLPPSPEPIRLVFIDSPWCPPCGDAWNALGSASSTFPPDSVHVVRILFDRERIHGEGGVRDVPPLHPEATPGTLSASSDATRVRVTTLTALPGPFRKQFRVDQVPVILLLDKGGTVEKRWIGHSPSLRDSLAEEVGRRTGSTLPAGT